MRAERGFGVRRGIGRDDPDQERSLNRPAAVQRLSLPKATSHGNLFISDYHRVRKVSSDGLINTVAGNGTDCFSGDGGPATSAQLSIPRNLAVFVVSRNGRRLTTFRPNRIRVTAPTTDRREPEGSGVLAIPPAVACRYVESAKMPLSPSDERDLLPTCRSSGETSCGTGNRASSQPPNSLHQRGQEELIARVPPNCSVIEHRRSGAT